jgi:hypothetical protein
MGTIRTAPDLAVTPDIPPALRDFPGKNPTVLLDYDGPRVFVDNDPFGRPLLAFQRDETDELRFFIVVPTNRDVIDKFRAGAVDYRLAMTVPFGWLVALDHDDVIRDVKRVEGEEILARWAPKEGLGIGGMLQPAGLRNSLKYWASQSILFAMNEKRNDVPFEVIEQLQISMENLVGGMLEQFDADHATNGGNAVIQFTTRVFDWIEGHRHSAPVP